jgi:hypothetical protein
VNALASLILHCIGVLPTLTRDRPSSAREASDRRGRVTSHRRSDERVTGFWHPVQFSRSGGHGSAGFRPVRGRLPAVTPRSRGDIARRSAERYHLDERLANLGAGSRCSPEVREGPVATERK